MKNDDIEEVLRLIAVDTDEDADERILTAAEAALGKGEKRPAFYWPRLSIRRTIMKHSWATLTAAATVAFLAVAVFLSFTDGGAGKAYAIEDSLDAVRSVRSFHMRHFSVPAAEAEQNPDAGWTMTYEMWVECDDLGRGVRTRVEWSDEGRRHVILWNRGVKIDYWPDLQKAQRSIDLRLARDWYDKTRHPRWVINDIYEKSRKGSYEIEVKMPQRRGDPIRLISTNLYLAQDDSENTREVTYYSIDADTKLIMEREERARRRGYSERDSNYHLDLYSDYDGDFPDEMFELPSDMKPKLEDLKPGAGLAQGDMTDEEAAREALRQYLQALAERDFQKAADLTDWSTPERLEHWLDEKVQGRIVRIEKIGEPEALFSELSARIFSVEYEFVFFKDGKEELVGPPLPKGSKEGPIRHRAASVGAFTLENGESRWVVCGGI